jgi:hypothetical protein
MNELVERLHIRSYFSLETDLAKILSTLPEFVSGKKYDIELRSQMTDEIVTTRFIREDEVGYISVSSFSAGPLLERSVGRIVYYMSAHSDNLMISRIDR